MLYEGDWWGPPTHYAVPSWSWYNSNQDGPYQVPRHGPYGSDPYGPYQNHPHQHRYYDSAPYAAPYQTRRPAYRPRQQQERPRQAGVNVANFRRGPPDEVLECGLTRRAVWALMHRDITTMTTTRSWYWTIIPQRRPRLRSSSVR